jgi:hypothetical protein
MQCCWVVAGHLAPPHASGSAPPLPPCSSTHLEFHWLGRHQQRGRQVPANVLLAHGNHGHQLRASFQRQLHKALALGLQPIGDATQHVERLHGSCRPAPSPERSSSSQQGSWPAAGSTCRLSGVANPQPLRAPPCRASPPSVRLVQACQKPRTHQQDCVGACVLALVPAARAERHRGGLLLQGGGGRGRQQWQGQPTLQGACMCRDFRPARRRRPRLPRPASTPPLPHLLQLAPQVCPEHAAAANERQRMPHHRQAQHMVRAQRNPAGWEG